MKNAFQLQNENSVLKSVKYSSNIFYYMQWEKTEIWNQVELSWNSHFVSYYFCDFV